MQIHLLAEQGYKSLESIAEEISQKLTEKQKEDEESTRKR